MEAFVILFIVAVAAVLVGAILFGIVRGIAEWADNNARPIESVEATVVAKRIEVSGSRSMSSTSYYCTFEVEGKDRFEFAVSGKEYGTVVEGDVGILRFQGTRYHGFRRKERNRA